MRLTIEQENTLCREWFFANENTFGGPPSMDSALRSWQKRAELAHDREAELLAIIHDYRALHGRCQTDDQS